MAFLNSIFPTENYERNELLGEGTFGSVRILTSVNDKKDKVVAKYSRNYSTNMLVNKSFVREVASLAALHDSINIITMLSFDATVQTIYLKGGTIKTTSLFHYMANIPNRPKPLLILSIILQITIGLSYMHCRGIWHRDIKSQNIIMCEKGIVQIIDLGSSTIVPIWGKGSNPIYTCWYTPPELLKRIPSEYTKGTITSYDGVRADIYAAGIILWELLTVSNISLTDTLRGNTYIEQLQCTYNVLTDGTNDLEEHSCKSCEQTTKGTNDHTSVIESLRKTFYNHGEKNTTYSNGMFELLAGMLHPNPCQRYTHADIINKIGEISPFVKRKMFDTKPISQRVISYIRKESCMWHTYVEEEYLDEVLCTKPGWISLSIYNTLTYNTLSQWINYIKITCTSVDLYPPGMTSMVHTVLQAYCRLIDTTTLTITTVLGCIILSDTILRHHATCSHMGFFMHHYSDSVVEEVKKETNRILHVISGNLHKTTPFDILQFSLDHDLYGTTTNEVFYILELLENTGVGWFMSPDTIVRCVLIIYNESSIENFYFRRHIPDDIYEDLMERLNMYIIRDSRLHFLL